MFVACDIMPFKLVESTRFKKLMRNAEPRFIMQSRKHLSCKLSWQILKKTQEPVHLKLQQAENVCLTIDLLSNNQMKPFMGVTTHCILNWTLYSFMLDCKRFKGQHNAENIQAQYMELVSIYGITSKVTTITTHNGEIWWKCSGGIILDFYELQVEQSLSVERAR